MTRVVTVCPCCQVPFTRTIAGTTEADALVPLGWYYDAAKADWCAPCRYGKSWDAQLVSTMREQP